MEDVLQQARRDGQKLGVFSGAYLIGMVVN